MFMHTYIHGTICFSGIFLCYLYYGILLEKILKNSYGSADSFNFSTCLVLSQCCINALWALIVKFISNKFNFSNDKTPNTLYCWTALTYTVAMISSNTALQWVNYPTQVIGKSIKPIPVMILGVLFGKSKYPLKRYFFISLVTFGVSIFMYKKDLSNSDIVTSHRGIGEFLLIISLICDGLTGASQERMVYFFKTNGTSMMLYMNIWSCLLLFPFVYLTGEIFSFISFISKYPLLQWDIVLFGIASALGQTFIFETVSKFSPLLCSIITTTRKFFTVLLSVIIYEHKMTNFQWIGVAAVFTGLILDSLFGKSPKHSIKQKNH